MFLSLFNEAKAAEAIAFLLEKSGRTMEILKLMKLIYLVERRSYEQFGEPIIGDTPYSFEHGPVLSRVYDLAKQGSKATSKHWSSYMAQSQDYYVNLKAAVEVKPDDLLNLSDSDIEILESIWAEFGHKTGNELRAYTHTLPEYEEQAPGKRSLINQVKLLKALGFNEKQAQKSIGNLLAHNRARAAFKPLA